MASGKEREKTPTPSFDTGLEWVSYDWAQNGDFVHLRFILKINPDSASIYGSGYQAIPSSLRHPYATPGGEERLALTNDLSFCIGAPSLTFP
eukprot:SAG31_NODE_2729_length_5177_cov_2.657542_7_plen_92_part_00